LPKLLQFNARDLRFLFFNTVIFKDDKRSKTQTSSPKQAPFLDQRSLPKAHGLQPALVVQAMFHLLLPVLIGLLNKLNYYNKLYLQCNYNLFTTTLGCPQLGEYQLSDFLYGNHCPQDFTTYFIITVNTWAATAFLLVTGTFKCVVLI